MGICIKEVFAQECDGGEIMEKKVVIVGGVAGGASAVARLRRLDENAKIVMFERGEYVSFANCGLPYYIGEVIGNRDALLVQTKEGMEQKIQYDHPRFDGSG